MFIYRLCKANRNQWKLIWASVIDCQYESENGNDENRTRELQKCLWNVFRKGGIVQKLDKDYAKWLQTFVI